MLFLKELHESNILREIKINGEDTVDINYGVCNVPQAGPNFGMAPDGV